MTRRKPDKDEKTDIDYGRRVANALAGLRRRPERRDLRAGLRGAGSDGRHRRHAAPRRRPGERAPPDAGEGRARPRAMLFDVPVVGLARSR